MFPPAPAPRIDTHPPRCPSLRACAIPTNALAVALFGVLSLLTILGTESGAAEPATVAAPLIPITSFPELWTVPASERDQPHPLRIETTIYIYDSLWHVFWGESGDRRAFVPCSDPPLPMHSGQRVLLEGTIVPSRGFAGDTIKVSVIDEHPTIETIDVGPDINDSSRFNQRMVWIEGYVDRHTQIDANHFRFDLISGNRMVDARLRFDKSFDAYAVDRKLVRMRGVYVPKGSADADSFSVGLWLQSDSDIEIKGSLADDSRFNLPVVAMAKFPDIKPTELVHVIGMVRTFDAGRSLVIRDHDRQAEVESLQSLPVRMGDVVDVIGLPSVKGSDFKIVNALFRHASERSAREFVHAEASHMVQLPLAQSVLDLSLADAQSGRPVHLNGVVTWSHPRSDILFIRDSSGGICVRAPSLTHKPVKGAVVDVMGFSALGPYAPFVDRATVEEGRAVVVPEPASISVEQAMTGNFEATWVEMRGYVSDIGIDGFWRTISITTPTGAFTALIQSDAVLPDIRGAIIRVHGVCEGIANERRQLTGVRVWINDPSNLWMEEAPLSDPFAVPPQSIASLRQFSVMPALNRWAHIKGVVIHQVPGKLLFLQDNLEGLVVSTHTTEHFTPGDIVDVVGLPGMENHRTILRDAVIRRSSHTGDPDTIKIDEAFPPRDGIDNRLVSISGTLVSVIRNGEELSLAIQNHEAVFDAVIQRAQAGAAVETWITGSQLLLRGVYRVDYDEGLAPRGFRLQLRSPADVVITRPSPWWTIGRTMSAIGILAGFTVLGLAWAAALRRRVRLQTEQIRAQLAKEAHLEDRTRSIIENASDFIFTTDMNGRFTTFNPAGERMTAFPRDQAFAINLRDLFALPGEGEHALREICAGNHSGLTRQTRFRTRDGRIIWVEISSRLIVEQDQPTGVLGIVRDITERKKTEEALEQARDAAEASTKAKSTFLATMSHEIRTPMNGVIGMTNVLLGTPLSADQHEVAETIRNSAEALLTVLDDILDFSKIEAGKLELEDSPFEIAETVYDTVDLLIARASAKKLELASYIAPDVSRQVSGDSGRLRQVILNLANNAIKFTETGEVVISVSRQAEDATHTTILCEITDTGIGIAPEAQLRLFQPFNQADNSMSRRFGGTGLGLAICRQLSELMGGSIGVRSAPGSGSTFWFTVRLARVTPRVEQPPLPDSFLAARSILCASPSACQRRIINLYLGQDRITCLHADDLASAAVAARAATVSGKPFDAVLVDYALCNLNSDDPLGEIRTATNHAVTRLVAMTTIDRRISGDQRFFAEADATINKPVRQRELIETLRRLFTSAPGAPLPPVRTNDHRANNGAGRYDGLRALVIEDNLVNQRVAKLLLSRLGFKIDLAGDGMDALETLERSQYDVIFMDCQMPGMDGFETTRRIRAGGRHPGLRIIAITANAMEGDRDQCLAAGMDDYVTKPMRTEDVLAALDRCGAGDVTPMV